MNKVNNVPSHDIVAHLQVEIEDNVSVAKEA